MRGKLITISHVNTRKDAGLIFEVNKKVHMGTIYEFEETKKDSVGVTWYKTRDGWICGKYVSLAEDAFGEYDKVLKKFKSRLRSASNAEEGSTEAVSDASSESSSAASTEANNSGVTDESVDIILGRRAFGAPYQFLSSTDIRPETGADKELGMNLYEALSEAPTISVLPGKPFFLADLTDEQRENWIDYMSEKMVGPSSTGMGVLSDSSELTNALGDVDIQYFSFQPDPVSFIRYMNTACWAIAIYLGIGDKPVPGCESSEYGTFGTYNWAHYTLANRFAGRPTTAVGYGTGMENASEYGRAFLDTLTSVAEGDTNKEKTSIERLMEVADLTNHYTDFYIDPNVSYSESFGNSTKQSMLAGVAKGASDMAKELAFVAGAAGVAADVSASQEKLRSEINSIASESGGFIKRIVSGASSIISGASISFPEMWGDSSYSRSYNISIPLKAAYGTREEIFMSIFVPMMYWVCLTAPRQLTINTFSAPYLCRCFIPGICSVDMGIVESLSIEKGGEGAWNVDGLPLQMTLNVSIKDLYSAMSISRINGVSPTDAYNFVNNNAYLDYLAVQGGLDLRKQEGLLKQELAFQIAQNQFHDLMEIPGDNIALGLQQLKQNLMHGLGSKLTSIIL